VAHDHAARIARKALGRSRGNVHAILEDRLTRRIGIREYRGFDVDHDLVALSGSAGIDSVVQGRFGDERERVGLLLLHRRLNGDALGVLGRVR
jgi:hypothetical protein